MKKIQKSAAQFDNLKQDFLDDFWTIRSILARQKPR